MMWMIYLWMIVSNSFLKKKKTALIKPFSQDSYFIH